MAKRKKSRSGKKSSSSQDKKGSGKKGGQVPVVESALFTAPDPPPPFTRPPTFTPNPVQNPAALTPKPALPERKREKQTRGGKPTTSTHELLAEVPAPPRAKPASPRSKPQQPPAKSPPPVKTPPHGRAPLAKPAPSQAKPAQARTRPPQPKSQHPEFESLLPPHLSNADAGLSQSQIYETLAALLVPYARKMESEWHPKIGFCLKAKSARTGRETHFGAVQALPDGVAYHLFPLYGHPDLIEGLSPDLFNRMRGKTCFHFDSLNAGLVAELAQLTHAGFERFVADGVF